MAEVGTVDSDVVLQPGVLDEPEEEPDFLLDEDADAGAEEEEPTPDTEDLEEPEEEETADDESDEEVQSAEAPSRAQKRIRDLVSQNKEIQGKLEEQQRVFQQQLAYVQHQQQQQYQEQQRRFEAERLEMERQRLEMERKRYQKDDESNLSEVERFRRQVIQDAKTEAESLFSTELTALKRELEAERAERQRAAEDAQRKRRVSYYSNQANSSVSGIVNKGLVPDDAKDLDGETREVLMMFAAAYGKEPQDVAPQFRKFLDRQAQARMRSRASQGGKKAKKTAPPAAPAVRRRAKGQDSSLPDFELIRKLGFDDYIDWMAAGEPTV